MNSGPYFAKKGKFGDKKVGEDKITTYEDYETAVLSIKASSELRQRLIFQNHWFVIHANLTRDVLQGFQRKPANSEFCCLFPKSAAYFQY